jgi:hypothetical protein
VSSCPFRNDELEVWETGFTRLGREAAPQSRQDRKGLRARIEASGRLRGGRIDLGIEVHGELIGHIQTYRPRGRSLPRRVYEIGVALWDAADRGRARGRKPFDCSWTGSSSKERNGSRREPPWGTARCAGCWRSSASESLANSTYRESTSFCTA